MKYIADTLCQKTKTGLTVCGDYCLCERTPAGTLYVLCDGIGSGVYANIAAITCAERIRTLWQKGFSLRATCENAASSMHRARTEDMPFSAFSAVHILLDGHYRAFTYESPKPILLQDGQAMVLAPRFYTAGFEVIGETVGQLNLGDALLLFSDGVTQAGMGNGYGFGIGEEAVCKILNRGAGQTPEEQTAAVVTQCRDVSGGRFEDDTTAVFLLCREANELSLFSGPPSKPYMDREYAETMKHTTGKKVVCGSTTVDVISRELELPVQSILPRGGGMAAVPEYLLEGIDLATEGAITLSQVCNVLEEPLESLEDSTAVKRLCALLHEADVVHMHIGKAFNDAHEGVLFKQLGVRMRRTVMCAITEKLRAAGKLVTERYY